VGFTLQGVKTTASFSFLFHKFVIPSGYHRKHILERQQAVEKTKRLPPRALRFFKSFSAFYAL
jgi:hypothetical protein